MIKLRYTLIGDGSSDSTLLHIIKWLLDDLYPKLPNEGQFADFGFLPKPPKVDNLSGRVEFTKQFFPFDILFIHRDAEKIDIKLITERTNEIKSKLAGIDFEKVVCVVPVKMMETWLLFDAEAIKKAAGNRNYKQPITLPKLKDLEKEQQPKDFLHKILKEVSGKKGRQLDKFNVNQAIHLVAENIEDFAPLRNLASFKAFEADLKRVVGLQLLPNSPPLKT